MAEDRCPGLDSGRPNSHGRRKGTVSGWPTNAQPRRCERIACPRQPSANCRRRIETSGHYSAQARRVYGAGEDVDRVP